MVEPKPLVLVVDDAALVRLYYRTTLESSGFRVEESLNGVEALEHVLRELPDVMIVDVNMPLMDGMTLLARLRQQPLPIGGIPVLVTSTESQPQDMMAARAAGANYYLVKPLTPQALSEHIAMFCGRPA